MKAYFTIGQPLHYYCPALQWLDVLGGITYEEFEVQFLIRFVGIILLASIFFMMGKHFVPTTKLKREIDQLLMQIKKCNNIIASVRHENEMHQTQVNQLNEEMIGVKANADRTLRQVEEDWKKKLAEKDESIVALKGKLKHSKTFWMDKLAEKEKIVASMTESCTQLYVRASRMELLCQEKCIELERARSQAEHHFSKWKADCKELKELKEEVIKWEEKCADVCRQLIIVQESANTLARAKALSEAKMTEMEANFKKALLKSKPRLIDLHYLIVQRLPPAVRPYASAVCFTLGLSMEFSHADDKFQVTAAFRRWLECDSSVPRTWGALLLALHNNFHCKEISDTWIEDITKDLVHGGIAALPAPEHFCQKCRQDFSKEHECYEIEDDICDITEAMEHSGTPLPEEMVVP